MAVACSGGSGDTTDGTGSVESTESALSKNAKETIVVEWSESTRDAILAAGAGPTVAARAIAEVQTAEYDAWTAYSDNATPTQPGVGRQAKNQRTDANKRLAISYAAFRVLVDLFPSEQAKLTARLSKFGGDAMNATTAGMTPAAVGNTAAAAIIAIRHADASNQLGDITPGAYSDYTGYSPVNTPTTVNDANRWQPLHVNGVDQTFITPQWPNVIPFALTDPTAFRPAPPALNGSAAYKQQAAHLVDVSEDLDDRRKVIAEYWTDGPGTSQAPGHWARLAELVSQRDHHSIDDDAKMFFALGNALLDTSIAVWESKRFYDSERPITAIRSLFAGKKVRAWGGPGQGTRTIDGAKWQPYEASNEVTPASPEDAAEGSAFAFAAAEILQRFTGSDAFGADFEADRGSSRVEPGITPRHHVRICWPTFTRAARQAGRAGQYRGVQFESSDQAGRVMGKAVATEAWTAAIALFHEPHTGCNHAHVHPGDCDDDDRDDANDKL